MEIYIAPAAAGKTTYCLEQLKSNPLAVMLVHNTDMADLLIREHPELKSRIFSIHSNAWRHVRTPLRFIVDNADVMKPDDLAAVPKAQTILVTGRLGRFKW